MEKNTVNTSLIDSTAIKIIKTITIFAIYMQCWKKFNTFPLRT